MNRVLIAISLLIVMLLPVAAHAAEVPQTADADLEAALALAGTNRAQLAAALEWCAQKPHAMESMRFVIANSPLVDLGQLTAEELIGNYELSLAARQAHGYGQHYDGANWAHFVLPLRMSQEPLSDWRSVMSQQLLPLVKDAQTLEEAALIVNRWCGERVRFEQTQRRDQGPLVTLSGGFGRCEELVMLFVCACRAVGVPARQAYCPWWATMDNNHAWAEVLGSDGKWHFTGGCEPADALDIAWFADTARQAPIVVSPCFGIPEDTSGLEVLRSVATPGARHCLLNSTAFYRQTGTLEVDIPLLDASHPVTNPFGSVIEPQQRHLFVRIFNYGALREIARIELTPDGRGQVRLGVGDYVLSTDAIMPDDQRECLVSVRAGEATVLRWLDGTAPGNAAVFHFPADRR